MHARQKPTSVKYLLLLAACRCFISSSSRCRASAACLIFSSLLRRRFSFLSRAAMSSSKVRGWMDFSLRMRGNSPGLLYLNTHKSKSKSVKSVPDPEPDPDPHVFGPPGSGSGSTSQDVWIRLRIRILLSSFKNSKKNLDSFYFVTLLTFYL
jgi:hypothetical protein